MVIKLRWLCQVVARAARADTSTLSKRVETDSKSLLNLIYSSCEVPLFGDFADASFGEIVSQCVTHSQVLVLGITAKRSLHEKRRRNLRRLALQVHVAAAFRPAKA